jgi:hypothetical protein
VAVRPLEEHGLKSPYVIDDETSVPRDVLTVSTNLCLISSQGLVRSPISGLLEAMKTPHAHDCDSVGNRQKNRSFE